MPDNYATSSIVEMTPCRPKSHPSGLSRLVIVKVSLVNEGIHLYPKRRRSVCSMNDVSKVASVSEIIFTLNSEVKDSLPSRYRLG